VSFAGDTNTNYDPLGHIGVVLEGNFETEHPTPEQQATLRALLGTLRQEHGISALNIGSHDDHASTACPGKHLSEMLPALIGQRDLQDEESAGSEADPSR